MIRNLMEKDADKISIPNSIMKVQISVIVKDARKAVENFRKKFGVDGWVEERYDGIEATLRGKPTEYKTLAFTTNIGPLEIELIQVLEGQSLYREFLETKGEGIHHIGLYVPNVEQEILKWQKNGIDVLQKSKLAPPYPSDGGYAYMDTEKLVGVLLELAYPPPPGL